jgi:hypothetical protein
MFRVRSRSDKSKGVPPELPLVLEIEGGGSVTILAFDWGKTETSHGSVVGIDAEGVAWKLNASGFAETDA